MAGMPGFESAALPCSQSTKAKHFMEMREEPRLFFANRPSGTPAFVNSPNLFTDGGEVEVRAFDQPGGELTTCFAGRLFCAMSLRTTISLTPSVAAACCMVIHRR
jgi:hypothetical protein